MVAELVFQVRKMAVNSVGRIGDVQLGLVPAGEKPGQVGLQAPVCTAQLPVGVTALPFLVLAALVEKAFPLGVPCGEAALKTFPVCLCQ